MKHPTLLIRKMVELNHMPNDGSAMLAVFCDLDFEDQAEFRPWLSEDMFPARLNIGFQSCASFNLCQGQGSEFVTLYETPSLGCLYDAPYQELRRTRNPRDTTYHKKFQNPLRYTLSWIGPEISKNERGFAPFLCIERFDPTVESIEEFNAWFVRKYLPSFLNSGNTVGLRRFIAVEGPHKYFVIQEFLDLETFRNDIQLNQKTKFGMNISGIYQRIIQSP
tara:strand:+ start:80 stop:742 length:663 start_codon:yes stop_codon:yes gene_type:complete